MSPQLLSGLLGVLVGIFATVLFQWAARFWRVHDPWRRKKLAHLGTVRLWMDSYRSLFDAVYPECPELILAHKMLSSQYPHYDKAAPLKLYEALKEYRTLERKHAELSPSAQAAVRALSNKKLERFYGWNQKATARLQKMGLRKEGMLLPLSFSTDVQGHLQIIDQYRRKVFEEFPCRVVREIEWDKLDLIPPEQLAAIVHPELHYFQANEDPSRDRERESKLFDEMQNLSFYRIVAKKEIDQVLSKIKRLEERYGLS